MYQLNTCISSFPVCIQDVTAGDGSDYEDSGIDGLTGDSEASQHQARRYKTMSASFSVYSTSAGGAFAGSDSGSSSGAGAGPSDGTQVDNMRCFFSSSYILMFHPTISKN